MGNPLPPPSSPKSRALSLVARRDAMDAEISAIASALTAPGAPGLAGNLVDAEGFPRADVDIHAVRTQRNRLACLRTDHAAVSRDLEAALHDALAPSDAAPEASGEASGAASQPAAPIVPAPPPRIPVTRAAFAVIDEVAPGGPAETAGLRVGDEVLVFGGISLRALVTVSSALGALPGLLREHEGKPVVVAVSRAVGEAQGEGGGEREMVEASLTPQQWSGSGLLGCHVVPKKIEEGGFIPQVAVAVATSHIE